MKKDEYRDPLQYERVKERARKDSALRSLAGREIAPLPAVANPARRASASASLLVFCKLYFAQKFKKPFGQNHLALIDTLQNVIADGGKQAIAMPRGTGKTTISTVAAIWALLTARRRFVVIVASNTKEARKLLKSIVQIIGSNQLLCQDFPEICVPVRALRGSALLARGQLFYGEPTNVQISADIFRLPTIPASPASGSWLSAPSARGPGHKVPLADLSVSPPASCCSPQISPRPPAFPLRGNQSPAQNQSYFSLKCPYQTHKLYCLFHSANTLLSFRQFKPPTATTSPP